MTQRTDGSGKYVWEELTGTVLALFTGDGFVESFSEGQEGGIILDRTNFYAESGGQTFDTGDFSTQDDERFFASFLDLVHLMLVLCHET